MGVRERSTAYLAFNTTSGPNLTVTSFPVALRVPYLSTDWGNAWPSRTRESGPPPPASSGAPSPAGAGDVAAPTGATGSSAAVARWRVSRAIPVPGGAANFLGRSLPRVDRQIFHLSPSNS